MKIYEQETPLQEFWLQSEIEFEKEVQSLFWKSLIEAEKKKLSEGVEEDILDENSSNSSTKNFSDSEVEELLSQNEFKEPQYFECVVDGAEIGDVPTCYTVRGLKPKELPVKGTFVHPKIVPGFSYVVRCLDTEVPLFDGRAMCLQRIGLGYGKRLTFAGESLNDNNNYFWSDTNPEGYGFSLAVVQSEDQFTVMSDSKQPIASLTVKQVLGSQDEITSEINDFKIEKEVSICMMCEIQYNGTETTERICCSGVALVVKNVKSKKAGHIIKVKNCFLDGENGFFLLPGTDNIVRTDCLSGADINDVPATYLISGLKSYELPVKGTYVDQHIVPGFKYKVRAIGSQREYFNGQALLLVSIGKGYAKRLTFEEPSYSNHDNYFWSDTNPDGFALTLEVVSEDSIYTVESNEGDYLGTAMVYKTNYPQQEISSSTTNKVHSKLVQTKFSCHMDIHGLPSCTKILSGVAYVEKRNGKGEVKCIKDISFDSLSIQLVKMK